MKRRLSHILLQFVCAVALASCDPAHHAQTEAPAPSTPVTAAGPGVEDEKAAFSKYAGAASCRECHAKEFEAWAGSHHGMAERILEPKLDDAAFVPAHQIKHASQQSEALKKDGHDEMVTLGFDGKREAYPIDRVIGHDPLRQFLTPAPGGRMQTLELAWDPALKEWFDVYGNEDRKPGEWGHWTGRGMTWNTMCATCHNTRLRKNYDAKSDTFHTTMAQMTVSCEACHGPMKAHNEWQTKNRGAKNDPTVVKLTRDQMLDTCAQCHSRRSELTGDFKPGDLFLDHHTPSLVDDSEMFYPDGQIHEEDYELTSFLGSKMHAAGVRCMDCHDPHTAKNLVTGDALCMRCHTAPTPQFPKAPVIVPAAHTFHKAEGAGARCISCHMPVTTYMQRHPRHDHGFTIPDPQLTKEFGIPNACNRCHADKDADWANNFTKQWFGDKMQRKTRERATIFAKARRGQEEARDLLVAWLGSDETPTWKASSALLLDRWAVEPKVTDALKEQLKHADPLVRAAAVRSLTPLTDNASPLRDVLRPLLKDPVRSVRLAAAWALKNDISPDSDIGKELAQMLALNADQPSGRMQMGQYEYSLGHQDAAIAQMKQALVWDQNSPPIHHDLALMLEAAGRPAEAVKELEAAIKLDPRQAYFHYELALTLNELNQPEKMLAELEQAVKLDPSLSRAWYNLGLARNAKGDTSGAIDALMRGEAANPGDSALPYARATILMRLNRKDEALEAAQKAFIAQPENPEYKQLLQALMRGQGQGAK